jgi:hypothetical protein
VGKTRLAQIAGLLWDSRRQLSTLSAAGTSLFSGIPMNLWDSTHTKKPGGVSAAKAAKSKSHFLPDTDETLENQWASARKSTLWDGCGNG